MGKESKLFEINAKMPHFLYVSCALGAATLLLCSETSAALIWQEEFVPGGSPPFTVNGGEFANGDANLARTADLSLNPVSFVPHGDAPFDGYLSMRNLDGGGANSTLHEHVSFAPIDISSMINLTFRGYVAAPGDAFDSFDYAYLAYSVDGGATWQKGAQFNVIDGTKDFGRVASPDAFADPTDPFPASNNGDLNDLKGELPALTTQFTAFSFSLPEASELRLLLGARLNSGDEFLGWDRFQVLGDSPIPVDAALAAAPSPSIQAVPEPASFGWLGAIFLLVMVWIRKWREGSRSNQVVS